MRGCLLTHKANRGDPQQEKKLHDTIKLITSKEEKGF